MIDTHAHIDTEVFDADRNEVVERAFNSGVESVIIPAIEPKFFNKVINTASIYNNVFCGIGIHPHNASDASDEALAKVEELSHYEKCVAIGEIGLDYHYDFAPEDLQREVFRKQLKIAKKRCLPVIVHNRESDTDLLNIIEDEQDGTLCGVLHCFSSPEGVLVSALGLGFHVSFTGNITFKKSVLSEVVRQAPLGRVMIETDSPYMTPVPYRGKRNEPSLVKYVAEKIAEIRSISIEKVIEMTTDNAKKLFKLAVMLIIITMPAFAQDEDNYDEVFPEEEYFGEEELMHPYDKTLGIGLYFGTNTIVETYTLADGDFESSWSGISSIGGGISYQVLDFLLIEGSYIFSSNTKFEAQLEQDNPGFDFEPNKHHVIEITTNFIANPYNRINFYGLLGTTLFLNSRDIIEEVIETQSLGLNAGIGIFINIPVEGAGLFAIKGEWNLNFDFSDYEGIVNHPETREQVKTSVTQFFSIPRVAVYYFPPIAQ